MIAGDFIRQIKRLAKKRDVSFQFDARHGKGSHGRVYYGDRFTTVKDRRKEIGTGLLNKMLADLGLTKKDLGL